MVEQLYQLRSMIELDLLLVTALPKLQIKSDLKTLCVKGYRVAELDLTDADYLQSLVVQIGE